MIARNEQHDEQRLGPLLELVCAGVVPSDLEPVAEVGRSDNAWPRTNTRKLGSAWTPVGIAAWLLEYARDERDEHLWVRIVDGLVRDVALGCRWAPHPRWSWRCLGTTDELLGAPPEVLAARVEAEHATASP